VPSPSRFNLLIDYALSFLLASLALFFIQTRNPGSHHLMKPYIRGQVRATDSNRLCIGLTLCLPILGIHMALENSRKAEDVRVHICFVLFGDLRKPILPLTRQSTHTTRRGWADVESIPVGPTHSGDLEACQPLKAEVARAILVRRHPVQR
jgi:hypothetical protein